jgi:hypothetical protein
MALTPSLLLRKMALTPNPLLGKMALTPFLSQASKKVIEKSGGCQF